MSCNLGSQFSVDTGIYKYTCTGISMDPIYISSINSGQILTLYSGESAWVYSGYDIVQFFGVSGLASTLQYGTNLYSFDMGLKPFIISGSGLPTGLAFSSYNTITGIPITTGVFSCQTNFVYCSGNPYTGISKKFTIIVCQNPGMTGNPYPTTYINTLGPKFYFDTGVVIDNCDPTSSLVSLVTGQYLVLQSGVPAWTFKNEGNYIFGTGNYTFVLKENSNLFIKGNGKIPIQITGSLPLNLKYLNTTGEFSTITGVPNGTGTYKVTASLVYKGTGVGCPDFSKFFDFYLSVFNEADLKLQNGIIYLNYVSGNSAPDIYKTKTIPYVDQQVKNLEFYYLNDNRFKRYFGLISGYGNTIISTTGRNILAFGTITDPTGWRNAIIYQTGTLTGLIPENSFSYTWTDQLISGVPPFSQVYIDEITGVINARNIIFFNTGLLSEGDSLFINDYEFLYSSTPDDSNSFVFNSPQNLANKLTSGATGDNFILNLLGVTGFAVGNTLNLFSYALSGEDGNSIKVYRDTEILEAIVIPNRYFVSGRSLRPTTNLYTGIFSQVIPTIIAEKSGQYTYSYYESGSLGNIDMLVWDDIFSGNYFITTGLKNIKNSLDYSGITVKYIPSQNIYSGFGIIPSGQNQIPTGFNIDILKRNYYDIKGNLAKYTISGNDFLFTGIIEG